MVEAGMTLIRLDLPEFRRLLSREIGGIYVNKRGSA